MVLPFVLGITMGPSGIGGAAQLPIPGALDTAVGVSAGSAHMGHGTHAATLLSVLPQGQMIGLAATLVHTVGYLLLMGLVAVLVYEKLGLRLLRTMWFNLDLIWAGALILTAAVTPLI